jgi:hypothetical protein
VALTDAEIQEIKNYLGYSSLTVLARPYFDIAAVFESVVQQNVNDWGVTYIRNTVLPNIRTAETKLAPSTLTDDMQIIQVDEVKFSENTLRNYTAAREWWIDRLAETIKVPRVKMRKQSASIEVG